MLSRVMLPAAWQRLMQPGPAHISLALAGLMLMLPFLYYVHQFPITTFYQEWGAAFLGFLALLLLSGRVWKHPEVPRIVLLPLGMAAIVLLQYALGRLENSGQAFMFSLYMLLAALMAVLGYRLREEFGFARVAVILAVFLLVGSELNALAGVAQHYAWRNFIFDKVVTLKISSPVYGNMAQPNHYADYITIGLVSLGMLSVHWRMRIWQTVLLAAPLLFVLVLSGSRSTWLFLAFIVGMAWLWERRGAAGRGLLYYGVGLLAGLALLSFVVGHIPWLANGYLGSATITDRIVNEVATGKSSSASLRLYLLRAAWLIFSQNPLLGAGVGQYAWQHFLLGPVLHDTRIIGLYNNPHNLVAQVAAEMGLFGLAVLAGTLILWVAQARKAERTIYHWWGYGLLGVLGIHSLLEYPLWYAFFLGMAAFVMGMMDGTVLRLRRTAPILLAIAMSFGGVCLWQLWQGYSKLERVDSFVPPGEQFDYHRRINYQRLMKIQGMQLLMLQPRVEFMLGEMGWNHVADGGKLNARVLHSIPVESSAYRAANLLMKEGKDAEARAMMERAVWAFPSDFPAAADRLRGLVKMDAASGRFQSLLEFGFGVYRVRLGGGGAN